MEQYVSVLANEIFIWRSCSIHNKTLVGLMQQDHWHGDASILS